MDIEDFLNQSNGDEDTLHKLLQDVRSTTSISQKNADHLKAIKHMIVKYFMENDVHPKDAQIILFCNFIDFLEAGIIVKKMKNKLDNKFSSGNENNNYNYN